MGYYHSTYLAYGIYIPLNSHPWEEGERADRVLADLKTQCPDVGHLAAGDYDRDHFFLVTESTEIELGNFKHVTPQSVSPEQLIEWNRQLITAAKALGYENPGEPGWISVPDLS